MTRPTRTTVLPEPPGAEKHWTRQQELAGLRPSHHPSPRGALGPRRHIATILRRRALRAWQRLRWRLAHAIGRLAWRLMGPDQRPNSPRRRLGWTCLRIEELLILPEYDDRKEGL